MRFGIVVFPGTWSDTDCHHVLKDLFEQTVDYLWHRDCPDLTKTYDCILLPGGFSYGDYLRAGAIARFSPIMSSVARFAAAGGAVIGICNGFQILCEAGLLPGVLMRNSHLQYRCQWANLRVERTTTPFTRGCASGQVLRVPISHGEGNYFAGADTLARLEEDNQVVLRYATATGETTLDSNPNGSVHNIAGIANREGNVVGMMPHPERCCEELMGGSDGRIIFESVIGWGSSGRKGVSRGLEAARPLTGS
jgi:phosphoribosylformylglycinamidine synthase